MGEVPERPFSFSGGLRNLLIFILLVLAVLTVLGQANPLTTRLGRDSGMYAYVASRLLQGNTPYLSAWEHKPPFIFFIDAAGLWLGRGTRWGLWGVELLSLLGAAGFGFAALKKLFGLGPAMLASIVWLSGLGLVLEGGNLTEEYALLFSFVSLWLFTRILRQPGSWGLHFALGLAFGCSFLTRPNNAGVPFAIVLTEALLAVMNRRAVTAEGPAGDKNPLRPSAASRSPKSTNNRPVPGGSAPPRPSPFSAKMGRVPGLSRAKARGGRVGQTQARKVLLTTSLGFLIPLLAAALYFLARNAFQAFLEAGFIYNLSYGGQPDPFGALLSGIRNLGFAAGIGLVGMWIAFDLLRVQIKEGLINPLILWLCLDFIIEIVLSGLSGLNYPHYFISWLPWIAFASALLVSKVFASFAGWSEKFAIPVLMATILVLFLATVGTWADYAESLVELALARAGAQRQELLPLYVNEHTQPGETVLVWGGEAGINFLAERDAPSAHFQYGILVPSAITDRLAAEFYQDIRSHPPALILDEGGEELAPLSAANPLLWSAAHHVYAPPYLAEFFAFVHANYVLKTSVAGVPIYYLTR